MTITVAEARRVLAAQAFSRLVGAELEDFGPGFAELRVPIGPELRQQSGFVHGGVLAYAADNASAFAGGSVLGPAVVTGGLTIDYVRPALGDLLVARAIVVSAGARSAVCRCELTVHGPERALVAVAQGTVRLSST